MSSAAPRSCLKPPPRNPWVADDGGESSTSSSQHQQQQQQQQQQQTNHQQQNNQQQQQQQQQVVLSEAQRPHEALAHQYATPYQPGATHPAVRPALSTAPGHSSAHSVSGHPVVSVARAGHSVHGVVHSHTAHSLHAHAHARPLPNAAHSVHSVPGSLQQPWVEPQLLWSTPALQGVGGVPGGVFTVGGGGTEGSCTVLPPGVYGQTHALHAMHHLPPQGGGSSGQTSTTGGGWSHPLPGAAHQNSGAASGWGAGVGVRASGGVVEGSRCEMCHYYCFRAAQAVFVAGIVTGFSLLVAGGVFHRQHVEHLQVLVYIGALVSLVCVVLLVIFCAMNKDHRTRRSGALRFSGPQVVVGDPEAVPLRAIEAANTVVVPSEASHGARTAESGSSMDMLHHSNHSSCLVGPPPTSHACLAAQPAHTQPLCYSGAPAHPAAPGMVGVTAANHSHQNSSEAAHHVQQGRQRIEEDVEGSRYNRIWKQPNMSSSEASKL
ncbi:uncharacterized protein LOC123510965 isoform X2 [Portunus trituberculatus]|uniref:uncharacterized protein LOC123510965 isoform X2 n=1 Tax=Portunus trituberculatus TaxID=210409 RepID=UPI001E1CF28A|nr:uncharacterized protein LOC123510965 isoform X2 [Portunus trituberculatus]